MLKGDLSSTPLAPLLLDLADDLATGCLSITDSAGEEAFVYYKTGLVYAVSVPGSRPQLGAKLVSSGAVSPEALAEALEAQRSELHGWRLGELLVHLGYVEQPVVEAFVKEQVSEAVWDLLRWSEGSWKFRKNERGREDVGPPMVVVELLEALRIRGYEWESISAVLHGPTAVPMLSARGDSAAETTLDSDAWSMLCKIDGERSVAELARDCGYTLFEAGNIIVALVQSGLVDIAEDVEITGGELYGTATLGSALAGAFDDTDTDDDTDTGDGTDDDASEDAMSRLARLVSEVSADALVGDDYDQPAKATALVGAGNAAGNPLTVPLHRRSDESFAASMSRVSDALTEVLGDAPEDAETPEEMQRRQAQRRRTATMSEPVDPDWERRKRQRAAAAAELASAQDLVETLRTGRDSTEPAPEFTGEIPKVLLTEADHLREAERANEEARRHRAEQVARAAAEQFAKAAAEEADRHAAEQEAKRLGAVQAALHREADEAEQAAAEERTTREAAEAAELAAEAERLATEEAERQAAALAERVAAEESAWAEYWHREEAERQAAEQAAAQAAEAERVAAEQAAQAEAAEREAAEEAQRQAAAEAERLAAEAAEREAAEAARLAAEAAEAERLAAEAERLAAEEAARLAAEAAEAERVEAEAERLAAEAEAAEAVRLAAEVAELEAVQAAAEAARQETERVAAEEAARQAAETEWLTANAGAPQRQATADVLPAEQSASATAVAADEPLGTPAQPADIAAGPASEPDDTERAAARHAEKLAAEEQAREADQAASAAALLIELATSTEPEPETQAAEPEPAPEADVDDAADPIDAEEAWSEDGQADTAALLRELSSLGIDDQPKPEGSPVKHPPRLPVADKKVKKKIGLFGL